MRISWACFKKWSRISTLLKLDCGSTERKTAFCHLIQYAWYADNMRCSSYALISSGRMWNLISGKLQFSLLECVTRANQLSFINRTHCMYKFTQYCSFLCHTFETSFYNIMSPVSINSFILLFYFKISRILYCQVRCKTNHSGARCIFHSKNMHWKHSHLFVFCMRSPHSRFNTFIFYGYTLC